MPPTVLIKISEQPNGTAKTTLLGQGHKNHMTHELSTRTAQDGLIETHRSNQEGIIERTGFSANGNTIDSYIVCDKNDLTNMPNIFRNG